MKKLLIILFFFSCSEAKETIAPEINSYKISTQPNILIILADDIGYEVPACNGGQSYSTPNIDLMAGNGKRFTQCHASPMCSPSRFAMLTGKYNFRNYELWGRMDTSERTIANMLKDAGYATCFAGKWQLDGGASSINALGFQNHCVWLPYWLPNETLIRRFRGAQIYQDGAYLPDGDYYPDDVFVSYLKGFMDTVTQPFFCFYSMNLCHAPLTPTPDHAEYDSWDFSNTELGHNRFFPAMVSYMDKKVGELITYLDTTGKLNNTLIIFTGDNGTQQTIASLYNGFTVQGGKKEMNEPGTNVPLIVRWNGMTGVSNLLIDFTDFLPTLAGYAGIIPDTFCDGLDINGDSVRKFIYNSYEPNPNTDPFKKWVQGLSYKLYDSTGVFVRIEKCKEDIPINNLTAQEQEIKNKMQMVLNYYN